MLRMLSKPKYRDFVLGIALLCAGAALVVYPSHSIDAGRQGLQLCFNVIFPSLFPFFVLSSLVVELGMARHPLPQGQRRGRILLPRAVLSDRLRRGASGRFPVQESRQASVILTHKKPGPNRPGFF